MFYSIYLSFVLAVLFLALRILLLGRKFSLEHGDKMAMLSTTKTRLESELKDYKRKNEFVQRSLGNNRASLQYLAEQVVELQNILFQLMAKRKSH
jgi:hypothetical protein